MIALGLLGLSLFCFWLSQNERREIFKKQNTIPMDQTVDFSRPGEYTFPYQQRVYAAHGQNLKLQIHSWSDNSLDTLEFQWSIYDAEGKVVAESVSFEDDSSSDFQKLENGEYLLGEAGSFNFGDYTFHCEVHRGVASLFGEPQRLVWVYESCPLEGLVIVISTLIGMVALGLAVILLVIVRCITLKKRKKNREIAANPENVLL
ncbi:hypothetical protein P3T73_01550 [Kiritimatiellota bacterium B12222]|nr:hypothetical protein P3T73_01550 [Kiritimatiellota bacterium B12222]